MKFGCHNFDLEAGRTIFMSSDHRFHSVPTRNLWQAREIDPDLIVLADSPEGWREFLRGQAEIKRQWNLRHEFTGADRTMLESMGIAWNDQMLEEYVLSLLPEPPQ
jgi:hypothetical protein